jgi:hypothetical protein
MQWHALLPEGRSQQTGHRENRPSGYAELRLFWSQELLKVW